MGFHSFLCAKTNVSIAAPYDMPRAASRVVLLTYDGVKHVGQYDGYGRVECDNGDIVVIHELAEKYLADNKRNPRDYFLGVSSCMRLVLEYAYRGETFDQLKENLTCPHQGYFYDENGLVKVLSSLPR
jgi:hypothetical protein